MKRPTDDQLNLKVAELLKVEVCECEIPDRDIWGGNKCVKCIKYLTEALKWATSRDSGAKLAKPIEDWDRFGGIVIALYSDHTNWKRDSKKPMPIALVGQILYAEPWLMAYAWIVYNGWEWKDNQWEKK